MELRKDYVLDRWVLIASDRKKRKHQFVSKKVEHDDKTCYFCPGNEHMTPPEIGRLEKDGEWDMRWFPNLFSAADFEGDAKLTTPQTHNDYFTFESAYGKHEIIAETPDHEARMHDFSINRLTNLLKVYSSRINALELHDWIRYVSVFKNEGEAAATSLVHSHSQLVSYNRIPKTVQDKVNANKTGCHYCKIIDAERNSDRRCFENEHAIAFTPYASRFNYEIWIFPKSHKTRLSEFSEAELESFADIMKQVFTKLAKVTDSFNHCVYYAPAGTDLHFHIEVLPRIQKYGGFELLTGDIINEVPPEDAAEFYRE